MTALGVIYGWDGGKKARDVFATLNQLSVGCLVALYADRVRSSLDARWFGYIRIFSICAITILYFTTDATSRGVWPSAVALATAAYVIAAVPVGRNSFRPFMLIETAGVLSYEIYLFHMMIFWALAPIGRLTLTMPAPHLAAGVLLISAICLCYGVALIIAKVYSAPMNRLVRRRFSLPAGTTLPRDEARPASAAVAAE